MAGMNTGASTPEEGQVISDSESANEDLPWVVDTQPQVKKKRKSHRGRRGGQGHDDGDDNDKTDVADQGTASKEGLEPQEQGRDQGTSSPHQLLLPSHVEVQKDKDPTQGDQDDDDRSRSPSLSPEAQGHLGDFTQIDADTSGMTRYYQAAEAEDRNQFRECEICGEKGHSKRNCSHLLCASCGAMDEHSTRDCPVGVSCFRCGKRGHRRAECTADIRSVGRMSRDCRRCGSLNHSEQTCPTYWRIYVYQDEDQWQAFRSEKAREQQQLDHRRGGNSSSDMDTDDDDDGYNVKRFRQDWDPAERWCYNCTARGTHWGDDCPMPRRAYGRNGEPSIFSEFLSTSGPFAYRLAPASGNGPPTNAPRGPSSSRYPPPGADMYDVSVGPNTSMHFAGGSSTTRAQPTIEEEVDRIFARAPRSSRGRVERDRPRPQPHSQPQPQSQSMSGIHIKGSSGNGNGNGKGTTNGHPRNPTTGTTTGTGTGTGTTTNTGTRATTTTTTDTRAGTRTTGKSLKHRQSLPDSIIISSDDEQAQPRSTRPLSSREQQSIRDKERHRNLNASKLKKKEFNFGPFSISSGSDDDNKPTPGRRKLAIEANEEHLTARQIQSQHDRMAHRLGQKNSNKKNTSQKKKQDGNNKKGKIKSSSSPTSKKNPQQIKIEKKKQENKVKSEQQKKSSNKKGKTRGGANKNSKGKSGSGPMYTGGYD
ncbi:unnamed protein product [Sympodiomycopsis kandeliae]